MALAASGESAASPPVLEVPVAPALPPAGSPFALLLLLLLDEDFRLVLRFFLARLELLLLEDELRRLLALAVRPIRSRIALASVLSIDACAFGDGFGLPM